MGGILLGDVVPFGSLHIIMLKVVVLRLVSLPLVVGLGEHGHLEVVSKGSITCCIMSHATGRCTAVLTVAPLYVNFLPNVVLFVVHVL